MNCSSLESISFNDNLHFIPAYCFVSSGLKKFTITDRITKIGNNAFMRCNDLIITISKDHPIYYIRQTEIIMKNSNVLVSIYNNNLSASVKFSNSVQNIDLESLYSLTFFEPKVLIFPDSIDSCLLPDQMVTDLRNQILPIKFETKFCKEGYKSISFLDSIRNRMDYGNRRILEGRFETLYRYLSKFFASNYYNYAETELSFQVVPGNCSNLLENTINETTNETGCDANNVSLQINDEIKYKQSGKYKVELAFLIIFIILIVISLSPIIYYQILLH